MYKRVENDIERILRKLAKGGGRVAWVKLLNKQESVFEAINSKRLKWELPYIKEVSTSLFWSRRKKMEFPQKRIQTV